MLRRFPAVSNAFDPEHIAEEIEDLGRSDLRAAQSSANTSSNIFSSSNSPGSKKPANHWHDAVVEWRIQLEKVLTRSIEAQLDPPSRYRAAVRLVRRFERDVPGLTSRLPQLCPYTLEQILSGDDEEWFSGARVVSG